MHHYFEAITNTSGDSLVGYFARVIDPVTQNTVTMSADDNGTPIITKSGVENMGSTDDYGNLDFYVVPGTYHLDIYAPNATSFIFRVPSVAMNSTKGDPGPQGDEGPAGEGLAEVMAPTGAGLVGFQQQGSTVASSLDTTAKAFATPAQFAGSDDQQVAQLLASGKRLIVFPEREMLLTTTHIIPPRTKIIAPAGAQFNAGVDNLVMFQTVTGTFGTQWEGGTFFGNGKANVTAFDLVGFRHAAEIARTFMQDISIGIYARELCWDVAFRQNFMLTCQNGIIIDKGCNAVTIDHPCISGFSVAAITINAGTDALPAVDNQIRGGYVQGGPRGVIDRARGTKIDGTYFEECTQADISWQNALFPYTVATYHSSTGGRTCIESTGTQGGYIDGLTQEGDRTLGLFDFDTGAGNVYCRARVPRSNTGNTILGNIGTLHIERRLGGTLEAGDIGWDGVNKLYGVQGTGPGSFITKPVVNGFSDVKVGLDADTNVLRPEDTFYSLVTGGETYTLTNMINGQTVTFCLKMSGAGTTAISIQGTPLDMTGVGDGKRKVIRATMIAADADKVWIDESPWK